PTVHLPIEAHYNLFCFWDETLTETKLLSLKEKLNIFHGLTILTKSNTYYDSTTFAMSKPHLNLVAYYFYIHKELQIFSQIFPGRARHLIKLSEKDPIQIHKPKNRRNPKHFFLPKRSARYYLGEDIDTYITTYEAICMKLLLEGKSYKEI